MSALAAAVPLMCVPFILRIAGPTNCVGVPAAPAWGPVGTLKSDKSAEPCGTPSTLILPAPPSPETPPGPTEPPVALSVPVPPAPVTDID